MTAEAEGQSAAEVGPFSVRAQPVDQTLPPIVESGYRFGAAAERAQQMASALAIREAQVVDNTNREYARFVMLWTIPREAR